MQLKEFIKAVIDEFERNKVLVECEFDIGVEPDMEVNSKSLNRLRFKIINVK